MWRFLILPDSLFTHKAPAQVPDPRPPPFFYSAYVHDPRILLEDPPTSLFGLFSVLGRCGPSFDSYETFIR
jgi:hypothetical protein